MTLSDKPANMDNAMNHNKGFTLIELMAVVAIVSILAVVALSAYADYVTRSKVTEGLAFAAEAKTSVSEYYYSNRAIPGNNTQTGLPDPAEYDAHEYISRLEVMSNIPKRGTITITYKIPGLGIDNLLQLVPSTAGGFMSWTCIPPDDNGISITKVPPNCRG
jgi:type IV pilus assembly protein PilA